MKKKRVYKQTSLELRFWYKMAGGKTVPLDNSIKEFRLSLQSCSSFSQSSNFTCAEPNPNESSALVSAHRNSTTYILKSLRQRLLYYDCFFTANLACEQASDYLYPQPACWHWLLNLVREKRSWKKAAYSLVFCIYRTIYSLFNS